MALFLLPLPSICRVTMQFDNRGTKVMDASTEKKIIAALAKHVFQVPAANVVRSTGMGQSSLTNHQVRSSSSSRYHWY